MTRTVRIFQAEAEEGFEWVQPLEKADFASLYGLDGSARAHSWQPIRVRTLERLDDRSPRLQQADVPWLGEHALVLRTRAYETLRTVLATAGEFLALDLVSSLDQIWLFNVCRVIDALDEEASEVVRFPSTGRIMRVKRAGFLPKAVEGEVAFRVPQVRTLFFSGRFVEVFKKAKLTGITFRQTWENME